MPSSRRRARGDEFEGFVERHDDAAERPDILPAMAVGPVEDTHAIAFVDGLETCDGAPVSSSKSV